MFQLWLDSGTRVIDYTSLYQTLSTTNLTHWLDDLPAAWKTRSATVICRAGKPAWHSFQLFNPAASI